jgi:hypothetical protein
MPNATTANGMFSSWVSPVHLLPLLANALFSSWNNSRKSKIEIVSRLIDCESRRGNSKGGPAKEENSDSLVHKVVIRSKIEVSLCRSRKAARGKPLGRRA